MQPKDLYAAQPIFFVQSPILGFTYTSKGIPSIISNN